MSEELAALKNEAQALSFRCSGRTSCRETGFGTNQLHSLDRAVSVVREKRAVSTVLFRACAAIPKIILLKGAENAGARETL